MKTKMLISHLVALLLFYLGETTVRSAAFTEVNWALTGSASQSSDLDAVHTAGLAIDGNTNGNWVANSDTHTGPDDPPWWEVDLGGMKPIARVLVYWRTDCCQNRNDDFTLTIMDANRAEIWKKTYEGRPPLITVYDIQPVLQGQIVRIDGQTPRRTSDGYLSVGEVEVIAPYTNVTINVTTNPVDVIAFENKTATFGPVAAEATDIPPGKFQIQWQKNDVDIPGALGATYTTPPLLAADNGAQFSAKFLLPGVSAISSKARLTVTQDIVLPVIDSISFVGSSNLQVRVNFSELMDPSTATNPASYVFGAGVTVLSAVLGPATANTNNVFYNAAILTVTGLSPNTNYSVTISGVKDLAGNAIATATLTGTVPFYEINYAVGGAATQSSNLDGVHTAVLAIDGNTSGNWAGNSVTHTGPDDPPWWEVDLGAPKTFSRISVYFRTDCCQNRNDDFTTIVLDASRNEVWRQTYSGRPPAVVSYDFTPATQGRIVRIEGQSPRTTSDGYQSLAEVQVLPAYQNASLTIIQGPINQTTLENRPVTFGPVTASVVGAPPTKVTYQWQKNGVDIPGATGPSFTTTPIALADSGSDYSVRLLLPGISVTSEKARVTVTKDLEGPLVDWVDSQVSGGKGVFTVRFNELLDPASAGDPANYNFGAGVTVSAATLNPNGRNVALAVDGLGTNKRYALAISGVKDLAGNTMGAASLAGTIQINYAITGSASQSSDIDGIHIATLAIDDNTDGNWGSNSTTHTANTDDPPVWEVDLGETKAIGEVRVWFRTDCCQNRNDDFTLFILNANHSVVFRQTYPGRPPASVTYNFGPGVQGQYVRIEGQTPRTTSDGYMSLAEVQVFNPFEVETLTITQGPSNVTAVANSRATFGPVVIAPPGVPANKVTYQWQRNGTNIPGAFSASYTTPVLTAADSGAEYTVQVYLPGLTASAKATLTVTEEAGEGPRLSATQSGSNIQIIWPVSPAGYVLESSGDLTSWSPVTDPVSVVGTSNSITIPNSGGARFYRLVKR